MCHVYDNREVGAFLRLRPLSFWPERVLPGPHLDSSAQEFLTQDPRLALVLEKVTPESLKQCYTAVSTVPIVLVYPFIQRYFIKGVLIGSIKR